MKRFIYVPEKLIGADNEIPKKAIDLSKETHLQIRLGSIDDSFNLSDIDIIAIPEKRMLDFNKVIEKGFIQSIDYTDEFVDFNKKFVCKIKNNENKYFYTPKIVEKHCLKFRFRIHETGIYSIDIIGEDGNAVVSEEYFEVV